VTIPKFNLSGPRVGYMDYIAVTWFTRSMLDLINFKTIVTLLLLMMLISGGVKVGSLCLVFIVVLVELREAFKSRQMTCRKTTLYISNL